MKTQEIANKELGEMADEYIKKHFPNQQMGYAIFLGDPVASRITMVTNMTTRVVTNVLKYWMEFNKIQ